MREEMVPPGLGAPPTGRIEARPHVSRIPAGGARPSGAIYAGASAKLNRSVYPTITDGHQSGLRRNRRGDGRYRQRVRAARPAIRDVAGSTEWRRSRRVDRAADGRRCAVAETSRGGRGQPGGSGVPDPVVGREGQPDGVGQAPVQGTRPGRSARPLRRGRGRAGGVPRSGPAGQCAGVVAALRRSVAVVVRDLRGHGARRLGDPHLRGAVRARAAADRRVRPHRVPARAQRSRRRWSAVSTSVAAARSC